MPADCGGQRHEGLGRIFFILYSAVLRPIPDSDEEARERIFLIEKTITILEKRGLTEGVLRYGFADDIAIFLISGVILDKIGLSDSMVSRWRSIFGIEKDGKDFSWSFDDIRRFEIWASVAPLDDLIGFVPPSEDEWNNLNLIPMEEGAVEESYVWLRDRYLFKDNLNVWKEVSLHKEYRFIR